MPSTIAALPGPAVRRARAGGRRRRARRRSAAAPGRRAGSARRPRRRPGRRRRPRSARWSAPPTEPDSTSPSRGPLVTTSVKTDDIRPRRWSGVTDWLIDERQTALTLSAAPASASSAAATHSEPATPASAIASAPRDDRPDDDPAQPARVRQPAGRQRRDRRAGRDRGVQQARPAGARVVDADRQHREQRARHPEGHRQQVDRERAHQRVVAAHEAQALGDRAQHRARARPPRRAAAGATSPRRRRGSPGSSRRRSCRRRRRPSTRDQHAADAPARRPCVSVFSPKLSASAERSCVRRHEVGHDRRRRHVLHRAEAGQQRRRARRARRSAASRRRPARPARSRRARARPGSSSSSRRRSWRSASAPPSSAIDISGTSSTAPSRPVRNADPVST